MSASEIKVSQRFMGMDHDDDDVSKSLSITDVYCKMNVLVSIVSSTKCFSYIEDDRLCCVTEVEVVRSAALTRPEYVLKMIWL